MTHLPTQPPLYVALPWLAVACAAAAACFSTSGDAPPQTNTPPGDPGPIAPSSWEQRVVHRLNRQEYSNTLRDLLGVQASVADQLPDDQQNELGYDNDGVSLVTSPLLVERYADIAMQLASGLVASLHPLSQSYAIVPEPGYGQACSGLTTSQICGTTGGGWYSGAGPTGYWGMLPSQRAPGTLLSKDGVAVNLPGSYSLSVKAFSTPISCGASPCPVRLHLLVDTTEKAFDVTSAGPSNPQAFTLTVDLAAGLHSVQAFSEFLPNVSNTSSAFSRTLYVGEIALSAAGGQASPAVAAKLLGCGAAAPASEACTTHVLSSWLPRAWRRPVTPAEVASLAQIVTASVSSPTETGSLQQKWDSGIGLALAASLTSPNFIYRPELDPDPASNTPHPVGDYELASRLSYFLWSSMPDDALFAKAAAGTLHTQVVLDAEVERMLADPKASALAENFAGQWLQLRKLAGASPDPKIFPKFNHNVLASMVRETTRFFNDFLQPGRALPDMIDANYTFIDQTLAAHYGMPQPSADFAQTSLSGTHRAGLLSQGGILTLTSMANRTSPVLRGKFVLSRLLCSMPPPPPPNVPPFNENTSEGSVRQRLEAHIKSGAACASCHTSLDPIGLSMENFDGVGVYRTADGPYPVDTTGLTYNGADIHDIASLAAAVKVNPAFIPCVSSQLYSYAMGQQATSGDAAVIASLAAQVAPNRYRLRDMIHAVTSSVPFVTRAGGL